MALYGDEYNRKMQQFNMMQGLDDAAYGRAWDNMNFEYGLYQDEYQRGQDALANARADAQLTGNYNGQRTLQGQIFDHNVDQDAFNNGLATADRTGYMPDGTMTWDAQMDTWDKDQAKNDSLLAIAETAAKGGDTSILKKLFPDLTDEQLAAIATALSPTTRSNGGDKTMTLTTAKAMAEVGQFTDAVLSTLYAAGYNEQYLIDKYGYEPKKPESDVHDAHGPYYNAAGQWARGALSRGVSKEAVIKKLIGWQEQGMITDEDLAYYESILGL